MEMQNLDEHFMSISKSVKELQILNDCIPLQHHQTICRGLQHSPNVMK